MDRYTIAMTIILLAGAAVLARIWMLVRRDDVLLSEPPSPASAGEDDGQGWAEDEAWDSRRIVF